MKKNSPFKWLMALFIFTFTVSNLSYAQVTTATLSGRVTDKKGKPIPDATVVVKFADAGIERSLVTKEDGRFTLANQRVGGPYTITVTHVMTHPELNR